MGYFLLQQLDKLEMPHVEYILAEKNPQIDVLQVRWRNVGRLSFTLFWSLHIMEGVYI